VLQFRRRESGIGEVEHGDAVEPVGLIGEPLGQEVVAAPCALPPIVDELEHLPPPTGVYEAVIDTDPVHPRDPFSGRRLVQRVKDRRAAVLLGEFHDACEQLGRSGPVRCRQTEQQIARDSVRELREGVLGELPSPRCERVLGIGDAGDLPVRVDVDDRHITMLCSWPGDDKGGGGEWLRRMPRTRSVR
jgi:hypothetical protein